MARRKSISVGNKVEILWANTLYALNDEDTSQFEHIGTVIEKIEGITNAPRDDLYVVEGFAPKNRKYNLCFYAEELERIDN
jgi:hypothetical protein